MQRPQARRGRVDATAPGFSSYRSDGGHAVAQIIAPEPGHPHPARSLARHAGLVENRRSEAELREGSAPALLLGRLFGLLRRRLGLGPAVGLALLLAGLGVHQRRDPRAGGVGLAGRLLGDRIAGALGLGLRRRSSAALRRLLLRMRGKPNSRARRRPTRRSILPNPRHVVPRQSEILREHHTLRTDDRAQRKGCGPWWDRSRKLRCSSCCSADYFGFAGLWAFGFALQDALVFTSWSWRPRPRRPRCNRRAPCRPPRPSAWCRPAGFLAGAGFLSCADAP